MAEAPEPVVIANRARELDHVERAAQVRPVPGRMIVGLIEKRENHVGSIGVGSSYQISNS